MSIAYVVTRDDNTRVRLPLECFGAFDDLHEWGLYSAIAAWHQGAPLRELLRCAPSERHNETLLALARLERAGHVLCTPERSDPNIPHLQPRVRYHAVGVEVIA